MKTCTKCGVEKEATNEFFPRNKRYTDGFKGTCNVCIREHQKQYREVNADKINAISKAWREKNIDKNRAINKAWQQANPEKVKALSKAWKDANPEKHRQYKQQRRARKRNLPSTLTLEQWETTTQYFNNCCAYCGKASTLTRDHFMPLSKFGSYTQDNIIPSCHPCNSSKGTKSFSIWYPQQAYYSKKREKAIFAYLGYKNNIQQLALM